MKYRQGSLLDTLQRMDIALRANPELAPLVHRAATRSQSPAISFMSVIRVASMAFAAYFAISAHATSIEQHLQNSTCFPVRTNGA
jgi:hypothetical protein